MTTFIPDLDTLVRYLTHHFSAPQPAERWAMYRLITPVVDLACQTTGNQPFFEYNQTSTHNTSQSVDIALLDEGKPRVLVEAKRAQRSISRDQIDKYLDPGLSGIVSNGADWILCRDTASCHVRIWNEVDKRVSRDKVKFIIDFIIEGDISGDQIDHKGDIAPVLRPEQPLKARRANRKMLPVENIKSAKELSNNFDGNKRLKHLDREFIAAFAKAFDRVPENFEIQARETRMSVWCQSSPKRERLMRIEFGKNNPSVIVKTKIVAETEWDDIFKHHRHEKHGGMREFRPASPDQARSLGKKNRDSAFQGVRLRDSSQIGGNASSFSFRVLRCFRF